MSSTAQSVPANFELPRPMLLGSANAIPAPSYEAFTRRFGSAFPKPQFLKSNLGATAVYDLPAPSGNARRPVLIMHGANTPALGMWPLAKELQARDPDAHIVLFDIWGHGLSSTPLVAHTQQVFHAQLFQILGFMQWTRVHLIGFSFGGLTAIAFSLYNHGMIFSATIIAPGGLLRIEDFDKPMQELLKDSKGRESKATEGILSFLEGGSLVPVLPDDWQTRVQSGEVVAEAFREWELREHPGYRHSVLSLVRDGDVLGSEQLFREFVQLPLPKIAVLGEQDPVCSESQLVSLGFENIAVVAKADHGLVRSAAGEIATIVHEFWKRLS